MGVYFTMLNLGMKRLLVNQETETRNKTKLVESYNHENRHVMHSVNSRLSAVSVALAVPLLEP